MKVQVRKLVLVAVSVSAVCLAVYSSAYARHEAKSTAPWLTHIVMTSTTTGWATTPTRVLRTLDGGRLWHSVLTVSRQSSVTDGPTFAFASIGSSSAWAVTTSPKGMRTYRTTNGGSSWVSTHQIFAGSKMTSIPGQLVLADPKHGWLLLHDGAALGSAPHEILRTSNGGRRWSRVEHAFLNGDRSPHSLPTCNGSVANISFMSATTGWATGICGALTSSEGVFETRDGGLTWRQEAVPTSEKKLDFFSPGQVIVADRGAQLLPVALSTPAAFVLYRTIDAGLSWKPTTAIPGHSPYPGLGPSVSYGALNNLVSWVSVGRMLYRTTDGGIRWYVMNKHSAASASAELDFVNEHDGFALSSMGGSHYIRITTDSGRHWRKIAVRRG